MGTVIEGGDNEIGAIFVKGQEQVHNFRRIFGGERVYEYNDIGANGQRFQMLNRSLTSLSVPSTGLSQDHCAAISSNLACIVGRSVIYNHDRPYLSAGNAIDCFCQGECTIPHNQYDINNKHFRRTRHVAPL